MPAVFVSANSEYAETEPAPVTAAPLSMACRFYATVNDVAITAMSLADKDSADDMWNIHLRGNVAGDTVRFEANSTAGGVDSSTVNPGFTINTWHTAVGVEASSSSRTFYLDGTAASEDTGANTPLAVDRMTVGARRDSSPTNYFEGRIMWAAVWNVALSATDAQNLSDGWEPTLVRRDGLVWYAPLLADEYQEKISGAALTPNTVMATTSAVWGADEMALIIGAHQFKAGDTITTAGLAPAACNDTFVIASVGALSVTVPLTPDPTITDQIGTVTGARLSGAPSSSYPDTMIRATPRGRGRSRGRFT
jgi:hypothetical protein